MIKKCWIYLIFCFALSSHCVAQDSILIHRLLHRLEQAQITKDSFYYAGMFASWRYYASTPSVGKPDNNIFFTALIAFTLLQSEKYLSTADAVACQHIIANAQIAYPYYQNRNGQHTYNFWPEYPAEVFPNSWFLHHFEQSDQLPDDADDTDIILLTHHISDSAAMAVKKLLMQHANTSAAVIKNTFRKYKNYKAYSTWFGKKMPIDFDFCVLCNTLYFIESYHLPANEYDTATIQLLKDFIENREYVKHPAYISPHYGRTPVLLYHIARLLGKFPIPELVPYKPQLIKDAQKQLINANNIMDKIILSTALIRLGAHPARLKIPDNIPLSKIEHNNFVFFIAGFYSMLSNPFKRLLSDLSFIKYFYKCPYYNDVLLLEYLSLSNKQ